MDSQNEQQLRRATEALLPDDASLSAAEVRALLQEAGADPEGLQAAFAAKVPLEDCAGFQALLPAYRSGTLAAARRALLDDHLHQCVACRHALHGASPAATAAAAPAQTGRRKPPVPAWAWGAAAAVIVAAILVWGAHAGVLPGQSQDLATVAQSGGSVFAVSGAAVRPVAAGYVLASGAEVRTGSRGGAALRLDSGTQIEMGRRTDVLLRRGWTGTTVHLVSGNLIVRASNHGWARHLYVETADSRITDQGTIFAVERGLMGSRVAVAEGSVAFHYEDNGQSYSKTVNAGGEATSNPRLALVPLRTAFGWSQNAGQYLAMLDELSTMGKQLEALPAPAPRYQSDLLSLVPANTVVYAAIPNLNQTLTQAHQIVESDLGSSPALQQWWNKPEKNGGLTNGQQVESLLQHMQQMTGYLGNEIAIAGARGPVSGVAVLASVAKPGLKDALLNPAGNGGLPVVTVVNNPAAVATSHEHGVLVWIGDGKMVASSSGALLQECATLAGRSGTGPFLSSALYQKVAPLYQAGASWILAADLNQLHLGHVHKPVASTSTSGGSGRSHPAFLIARSQLHSNGTPSYLQVDFSGPRAGLAGMLAAPGPMGGLQFVSPDATVAVSFLTETPAQIINLLRAGHHDDSAHPSKPEKPQTPEEQAVQADAKALTNTLGGEFTFAQDGPVLPKPGWKAIVEVNDTQATQNAISQLVHDVEALGKSKEPIALSQQTADGQTIYTVSRGGTAAAAYTFAGSYLLAGSSVAEVEDGLQTYNSGSSLPTSNAFQSQLPQDGHTNFSALFYHNLGTRLAPLAQKLLPAISATWRPEVQALLGNAAPGLTYAYATPTAIEVASNRGLLGLTLQNLLTLQLHAKPSAKKSRKK